MNRTAQPARTDRGAGGDAAAGRKITDRGGRDEGGVPGATRAMSNDAFTADFEKGAEENSAAHVRVEVAAPVSRG